jgi:DNA invertase Pin-like site-specific DNA recombinase
MIPMIFRVCAGIPGAGKASRRRCASFAPPEPRRCSLRLASGAKTDRPQLRRLLAGIGPGDVVMVTRLDRLARSTRDLLDTLAAITGKEAGFRSLGDTWADTTTSIDVDRAWRGLGEFDRDLICARTGEGRSWAKGCGQSLGRPPKLTPKRRGSRPGGGGRRRDPRRTRPPLRCSPKYDLAANNVGLVP